VTYYSQNYADILGSSLIIAGLQSTTEYNILKCFKSANLYRAEVIILEWVLAQYTLIE